MHTENKLNRNRHSDIVFDMLEHVYSSILASFHIQFQIKKNNKTSIKHEEFVMIILMQQRIHSSFAKGRFFFFFFFFFYER